MVQKIFKKENFTLVKNYKQKKEILAIIPDRGGSKGIPRKNIKYIAGKPLIAYTIESAFHSQKITRVVVSTDDVEIASVANNYYVEVVKRPLKITGDTASSESALIHTIEYLRENEGYEADIVVFLQCTTPLTLAEDIDGTDDLLLKKNADSALAVAPFHYFLWEKNKNGDAVGINHDKRKRALRQECGQQFIETGAVYVMHTTGFMKTKHRFYRKTVMYIIPEERCLEIDDP